MIPYPIIEFIVTIYRGNFSQFSNVVLIIYESESDTLGISTRNI